MVEWLGRRSRDQEFVGLTNTLSHLASHSQSVYVAVVFSTSVFPIFSVTCIFSLRNLVIFYCDIFTFHPLSVECGHRQLIRYCNELFFFVSVAIIMIAVFVSRLADVNPCIFADIFNFDTSHNKVTYITTKN